MIFVVRPRCQYRESGIRRVSLKQILETFLNCLVNSFELVCSSVVLANVFNFLIRNPSNLLKHFFKLCPLQCWLQSHNMALGWLKYTQIHTSTVVTGERGWMEPYPEFLICCSIFKRFGFQWKAFDLLLKQDEVYFVGDGAVVGLWRHQYCSPSWILPGI